MTSMFRRIACAALVSFTAIAGVQGQEPVRPPVSPYVDERAGVSLADAIARALEREPSLRSARKAMDVAQADRRQAGLRANPSLTFEQREEPAGTDRQTSVGVRWPLELFRRQARVETATRVLEATTLAVVDDERLTAAEVRVRYGAAAAAARDVTVADELVATTERQAAQLRARVDVGSVPALDRDRLEVELARLRGERLRAIGRADAAVIELKRAIGMRPDEPLLLQETLETLVRAGGTTLPRPTTPEATAERPDVRESAAQIAVADARIDQARQDGRVDVDLFAAFTRMDAGFAERGFNAAGELSRVRGLFTYVSAGAMVTLPLFDRKQGRIAAAQADRARAEARYEATTLAARAEIATALALDAQARQAIDIYADRVRPLAKQNLDVVRQTYELGRGTIDDVLAEQRRFLDIEHAYTETLKEAWEARAAWLRARGEGQ